MALGFQTSQNVIANSTPTSPAAPTTGLGTVQPSSIAPVTPTAPTSDSSGYTPLTPTQYQAALDAGYKPDEILANEQKRKQESAPSNPQGTTGGPGFFSRLGHSLVNEPLGQFGIGIAKGIGGTIAGATSAVGSGLNALAQPLEKLTNQGNATQQSTPDQVFGKALAPKGLIQGVGNVVEKVGELATPTPEISGLKDIFEGSEIGKGIVKAAEEVPVAGKALSYITQKTLRAIPEALFGTGYGLSQGETPGQSIKQGGVFGLLSGLGEVAGDTWKAIKGGVVDNINKALGATGKMSVNQAIDRVPKALNAFQTMANSADDIMVKTVQGVEKTWEPAKDGFYEALQGLQQTKQKIFNAYTDLADKAGSQGAQFLGEDFGKVMNKIATTAEDATAPFKSKAMSLINDLKENYGQFNSKGEFTGFKNTPLPNIQNFIQKINTDVNPLSDKAAAEVSDTASKILRSIMDGKIEDASFLSDIENKELPKVGQAATGDYQKLRNTYSDLKSIENDMVNQLKKNFRGVGGRVGQYVEGFGSLDTILGALSHNPMEMAKGLGTATIGKVMNYLRDPEVGLQNAFEQLQNKGVGPLENRLIGGGEAAPAATAPGTPETPPTAPAATPPTSAPQTPTTPPAPTSAAPATAPLGVTNPSGIVKNTADVQDVVNQTIHNQEIAPVAQQATDLTKANGGVTIGLHGDIPTEGYSVATDKTTEFKVPQEQYSPQTTADYVNKNWEALQKPGNYLGMWIDNGEVYYDVPSVFNNKADAVRAAKSADQLGIFDLKNFNTIGNDEYEKIIADDEAAGGGNSAGVQPASSQKTPGEKPGGPKGKVKGPKGTVKPK